MKIEKGVLINVNINDIKNGKLEIPKHVTHIGGSAFRGCAGLTSVTLPESLTHIGD